MQSMRSERSYQRGMSRMDDAMHSSTGRIARVAIGGGLLGLGIGKGGRTGALTTLIGLEPLLAGLFNFSLLSFFSGRGSAYETAEEPEMRSRMGSGSRPAVQSHTEANVGVESGNVETSIGT